MKNKSAQSKAWKTVQIARHPERPQFLDYASELFDEFDTLHGDRVFGDDGAMIGGLARFNGQPVMVVEGEARDPQGTRGDVFRRCWLLADCSDRVGYLGWSRHHALWRPRWNCWRGRGVHIWPGYGDPGA